MLARSSRGQGTPADPRGPAADGSTLLFDADDTLWENNIYFDAIVEAFAAHVVERGGSASAARETLLEIERVRTREHGYGVRSFNGSLRQASRRLLGDDVDAVMADLDARCARLLAQPMALLPDVVPTLAELARRHRLLLLTKGDPHDQHAKVERSGLARFFAGVEVVKEKDPETYRGVLARFEVDPARAWMVGNSPKSDVLPALAVGLGAVFVPHAATWVLEHEVLPTTPHPRLLVLDRFKELTRHF